MYRTLGQRFTVRFLVSRAFAVLFPAFFLVFFFCLLFAVVAGERLLDRCTNRWCAGSLADVALSHRLVATLQRRRADR